MSKQSEAKARQNYQDKPLSKRCRECKNLEIVRVPYQNSRYFDEKLSCKIGGFRVKANSICDLFEKKQ